jgi:c-di-GMP-binding flagellar brake protein YcgR
MALVVLVIIIGFSGLAMLFLAKSKKEKQGSWIQFFAKGKDAGFSFKEIELLRRLAAASNLEDPSALFWSQNQLDLCIRSLVRGMRFSGSDKGNQEFLSKLYDYRKKIEMEKPKVKNGISSSQQVGESQKLRVLVSGTGVFNSQVIKNTNQYMTIARPVNPNIPASFSWTGLRLSVYFWREDDAGYVFDTTVTDEVFSKGLNSLKVEHSDSLFRTQKRKAVRVKTHKIAFLYLLANDEPADKIEVKPGLKCYIEDLSDTGCAVTIGGKAMQGLRVKIQFTLDNVPIIMSGTVRSAEYNAEPNRSLLHIEANPLPTETRNHILGEVFGMLPEEEELPFRVLDDEVNEAGAQNATVQNTTAADQSAANTKAL